MTGARAARFIALVALAASSACSHGTVSAKTNSGAEVILSSGAGELHVQVEIARTEPDRERGLMFRQKLEPGHGMLFLFDHPQKLVFWMKNTYIPLDMIFINAQMRVVYVEENAEPLTLNARGPTADTQFVLEVPGGWSHEHGVGPGVAVRFVGVD